MSIPQPKFSGLKSGKLVLKLIEQEQTSELEGLIGQFEEQEYFLAELHRSYLPKYDDKERRLKYGFYVTFESEPAGFCLLGVSSWGDRRGYTGADTLPHMRGRSLASQSKPLLFYLAFEMLGLHRVETGCLKSNTASRKSIEKTAGFQFEGTLRDFKRVGEDQYEDELRWSILKRDWLKLYSTTDIDIIR